jgi:hypothetical protein
MSQSYDLVVVGAGLAGLTAAYHYKTVEPDARVLIVERSDRAGGLTGDWLDHRIGGGRRLQPPMHMIFREKYPNLLRLVQELEGELSPLYDGYDIITSDGERHRLEMNDWTASKLPPPLHALGMFAKLKLPLRSKWNLLKLGSVATYCAMQAMQGEQDPRYAPSTMSLESLELLLGMDPASRDFMETVTPSITNLHPWYTSGYRMGLVMAGTMTLERNSLRYHVFGKNYNAAFIDRYVAHLREMGVTFRFRTELRRIDESAEGSEVESIWVRDASGDGVHRYVCDNCGAENFSVDRAFCTRCGDDTTLDKVRAGSIKRPVGSRLWEDPTENGYERIPTRRLITAMYPHMIAKVLPAGSALRRHPYVRSFFSSRGNQTQLSIARVYYKKHVTSGAPEITGTHNPTFAFNGCQSVLNNFGAADLGVAAGGDVIDVLLDVGVIRDAHTRDEQVARIVEDLQRVYPAADPDLVEHVSFANMYPDVLYLSEQPAIGGLHRFFDTHRTGARNWYVAGCHSGLIGIGMESAVQSAMATINCLLEDEGHAERVDVLPYDTHPLPRVFGSLGKALMWWRLRGGDPRRRMGARYSTSSRTPIPRTEVAVEPPAPSSDRPLSRVG